MRPLSFEPALPLVCLALALGAPFIALFIRHRQPHRQPHRQLHRQPHRARITGRQTAATLVGGVAGLVVLLVSGLVLEMSAAEALTRTSHGAGTTDPMSWLGAATALISGGSRLAWQAAMLLGPLLFALDGLADWRLPTRLTTTVLAVMVSPLFALGVVALVPLDRPPSVLLAAVLLWVGIIGLVLHMRGDRATQLAPHRPISAPSQPRPTIAMQVAGQPTPITDEGASDETEISLLPAALALQIDHVWDVPTPAALPIQAPLQLPPAAVRRARRLRDTIGDMPRRRMSRG
ncbi:MAG: hypothetical protein ACI9U2_001883 [Bradymonadia bacterium]|jgi:hypothetical protein